MDSLMVNFKLGEEIRKMPVCHELGTKKLKKTLTPDWNRFHDLTYTGRTLLPLSYWETARGSRWRELMRKR